MSQVTRPADPDELRLLWPSVSASHLFDDADAFLLRASEQPWSVRVTGAGEAVVLGRWREHLDLLAVRGIWCSTARVPVLIEDLRTVARDQGFTRLLGPLVPDDLVRPYVRAGLAVRQRIVVYRMRQPNLDARPAAGVTVRVGGRDDLAAAAGVDAACFDDFWRYDEPAWRHAAEAERLAVAETAAGKVIGYTLCTVHGPEATVGRLAVSPDHRGAGVGSALLADAVASAARRGAAGVTLCTQEENGTARRLYESAGFREAPGRLVSTISAPL